MRHTAVSLGGGPVWPATRRAPWVMAMRAAMILPSLLLSGQTGWGQPVSPSARAVTNTPAAAGLPTAAEATPSSGIVQFKNGDLLHGQVVSIDSAKLARLSNPQIKEVMEFTTEDITRIQFAPGDAARLRPRPAARLQFWNNDTIVGDLTRLERDKVIVETWYAGNLTLPREKLRTIHLQQNEDAIYHGPTGLEGWTVSDSQGGVAGQAWGYQDGVFFSRQAGGGGIAREMQLPDAASIDLDVAWREFLQLTITLYTDSLRVYQLGGALRGVDNVVVNVAPPAQEGAGFYAVQINRNTVYLLTVRKDGQVVNSPLDMVPGLERASRARLGVRTDKKRGTISLLLNGQLVKTWKETGEFAGQGTAIRLVHQGQTLINLSNIRVARWDGVLEAPAAAPPKLTQDLVQLRNQDSLSGTLEGIREGKLAFSTSFGTLEIPLDRVARIEVATKAETNPGRLPGLVRARFAGGHTLTFKLEEWTQGRLVVTSPVFGRANFDPAAFELLEFEWQ